MGFDNDQDDIVLEELDNVVGPSEEEAEAAATEEIDDSQLTPEDGMRRRSAKRREERERRKARRKELDASSPDTGRGRRRAIAVVAVLLCVTLVAGGVYYFYFRGRNSGEMVAGNGPTAGMDFGNIEIITASGTTSIGMSLETFDLNLSDVELTIDEVYVSNRDEVDEGQPILKIDEDTIATARTKLQQNAKSAEYAYQLNEIDAQVDVIEAKETYEQALIALQYAEQDYADTVSAAQAEISSLERQIVDQQELVDEYQAAVDDPQYYYKEYDVEAIKKQLEEDQQLLEDIYNDDSTRVADHLDYLYGGSYEAYLNGETVENDNAGGGMPGGGAPGGNAPSAPADQNSTATDATANAATGTTTDTGTNTTTDGTGDTNGTADNGSDAEASGGDGTAATSETVSSEVTYAPNEILIETLSAPDRGIAADTEVVTNKTYHTEAPAQASGSVPATTGATAGGTSAASGSSSASSSGSATITDEYVGTSSDDFQSPLSTSQLSTSDLSHWPWYSAYVALDEEVSEEHDEYEEAVRNAERDQARASSLLSQSKNKLESLQLKLRTAKNDLITTQEEAQETLDTVRAEATAAQETYNTTIRSIENTADTLKDTMDQADEDLASFEEQIGDGYLYTSNAGTIMMVGVEEGDTLTYNAMVAAYTDPGTISVGAAVDQSYIASVSVGDTVAVVFEEEGIYQGYVAAINPVTQSSSRTSVTYNVTVELEGDVSEVEENISATVYFGDAVPLVFEQAGDQLHSPDATTEDSSEETDSDSSSADTNDEGSALEALIDQTDAEVAGDTEAVTTGE